MIKNKKTETPEGKAEQLRNYEQEEVENNGKKRN